jgi:hypothetical protein
MSFRENAFTIKWRDLTQDNYMQKETDPTIIDF